jgi:hypothetical protein
MLSAYNIMLSGHMLSADNMTLSDKMLWYHVIIFFLETSHTLAKFREIFFHSTPQILYWCVQLKLLVGVGNLVDVISAYLQKTNSVIFDCLGSWHTWVLQVVFPLTKWTSSIPENPLLEMLNN